MSDNRYDALKLENQLCFPLYACAKEIVRKYTPLLDRLDLTYTQYITMMALWEHESICVKELGKLLYLDSGTLTPLLKKLEGKGYILRKRSTDDERSVTVSLTEKGVALKQDAADIPMQLAGCVALSQDEAVMLHSILHKILESL